MRHHATPGPFMRLSKTPHPTGVNAMEAMILSRALHATRHQPSRNYVLASPDDPAHATMQGLVRRGLMRMGHRCDVFGQYYHATQAGARAVDLPFPKP